MPRFIIDAHTHFSVPEDGVPDPDSKMLDAFAKAGVVGAVVHLGSSSWNSRKVAPPEGLKLAVCAPGIPDKPPAELESRIRNGDFRCIKIYLGYVYKYASDPVYTPYYEMARKYRVPVVFHTGDTYDKNGHVKYADPLTIDEVAVKYRDVKFVIAHIGNPWIATAAEVTYKNDNLYVDVSALMLGDVSTTNPAVVDDLVIKPIRWFYHFVEDPKKILYGSDWPLLDIGAYRDAVARAIPREHWNDVFYNNANEVFALGLPPLPSKNRR